MREDDQKKVLKRDNAKISKTHKLANRKRFEEDNDSDSRSERKPKLVTVIQTLAIMIQILVLLIRSFQILVQKIIPLKRMKSQIWRAKQSIVSQRLKLKTSNNKTVRSPRQQLAWWCLDAIGDRMLFNWKCR